MARIIIADAGPLIALAGIDQLAILKRLFSRVSITRSVQKECLAKPGEDTQRIEQATDAGWLDVVMSDNVSLSLSTILGIGESDSIRLAMNDPQSSLVIVDDRLARRYALHHGLNIIGTVRVLGIAEQRGLIDSAKQCILEMRQSGYRVSVELLLQIRAGQG